MPKVERDKIEPYERSVYPGALRKRTVGYQKLKLSEAGDLTQFGIGEVTLEPGSASGIFHWHTLEDEFLYVLEGELTVIEGSDVYTLGPGESATFKAGVEVGHTAENRSDKPVRFLELGTRNEDEVCFYPGLDMRFVRSAFHLFENRAGKPLDFNATPDTLDEPHAYNNVNPTRETP